MRIDSASLWQSAAASAAFLFILLPAGCKPPTSSAEAATPPPPTVVVAEAITHDIANSYEYIGQIVAEESVELVARVEGFLTSRNFEEGSNVRKGDIVFTIEKAPYQAQLESARSAVLKAKTSIEKADIEFERNRKLFAEKAVAQRALDNAKWEKDTADAELLNAQASLDVANLNLGYTDIRAPFDGKIGECDVSVGNLVGPSSGRLATIVAQDPVKVEFSLPEPDFVEFAKRKKGLKDAAEKLQVWLRFTDGTRYETPGEIYFIGNKVNPKTGTIAVRARFANPDAVLTPGGYVKAILETKEKSAATLIPSEALQMDQSGSFVMVVDAEGKARRKAVTVGVEHGARVVVASGLNPGERVITQGLHKVRPNMPVKTVVDVMKPEQE